MNVPDSVAACIRGRRSVRRLRDDAIAPEVVEELVALAAWAPSARNGQEWTFIAVRAPEVKRAMAGAVRARWEAILAANVGAGWVEDLGRYVAGFVEFQHAPVVIVVATKSPDALQAHLLAGEAHGAAGNATSAAMAAQNFMLAAHARGLGTCCMTGALAAHAALKEILGLGVRDEIVCLITLGKPAETPRVPPRKPVTEILRWKA